MWQIQIEGFLSDWLYAAMISILKKPPGGLPSVFAVQHVNGKKQQAKLKRAAV